MTRRIVHLLLGLVLFGAGMGLIIRAEIGVTPWDVLGQGLVLVTGWSFGAVTIAVGVVVMLLWIPLRQRPGAGTLLNILILGPVADVVSQIVPSGLPLVVRILLFAAGLLAIAIGSGLYIGVRMGPGPRDGLMTGLNERFGWPVWAARTSIEAVVFLTGWLLGGNAGVGSLAFALLIGPLCNVFIPMLRLPEPPAAAPVPAAG